MRQWRLEIGPIGEIEHFGAELQAGRFRDKVKRETAFQRIIEFRESRSDDRVSAGVSQQVGGRGKTVVCQVDVLTRIARIRESRPTGS